MVDSTVADNQVKNKAVAGRGLERNTAQILLSPGKNLFKMQTEAKKMRGMLTKMIDLLLDK